MKIDYFDPDTLHTTVELGRACLYKEHESTLNPGKSHRYTDTHACVHCVQELAKPGLIIDVNRVHGLHYRQYLRFWNNVAIGGADDCWPWVALDEKGSVSGNFARPWATKNVYTTPSRVAIWYSWGDVGMLPYRRLCDTRGCCNPLHLRVDQVPHYVYRREIDLIDFHRSTAKVQAHTRALTQSILDADSDTLKRMRMMTPRWLKQIKAATKAKAELQREP